MFVLFMFIVTKVSVFYIEKVFVKTYLCYGCVE